MQLADHKKRATVTTYCSLSQAVASRGGAGGGGSSAPGPGPVVGARAKLDFFFDRAQ